MKLVNQLIFTLFLTIFSSQLIASESDMSTDKPLVFGVLTTKSADSTQEVKQNLTTFYRINVDYLENIAEALDLDIQLKGYSDIESLLNAVESSEVDGTLGFSLTPERTERFLFSEPLFESTVALWYEQSHLKDLPITQLRWACVENSQHCNILTRYDPKKLQRYPNFEQAMNAVLNGEAQAIISSFISLSQYLDANDIVRGNLTMPPGIETEKLRILTSKNNLKLITKFNEILHWEREGLNIRSIASQNRYHVADKILTTYRHQQHSSITYSTSSRAYPFFYKTEDGEYDGFLTEFFQLIQSRTGLQFKYSEPTQSRGDLAAFNADLVPVAYSSAPPKGSWALTDPFLTKEYVSVETKSLFPKNSSAPTGILISVEKQGIVHLESWRDNSIIRYDNLSHMLDDLKQGKLARGYIPENIAYSLIAQNDTDNIVLGQAPALSISLAFAVNSNQTELVPLLNALIKTIDESELHKINQRFQRFRLHYGYSFEQLANTGALIVIIFAMVVAIAIFRQKHLNLKIKLAESNAKSKEREKHWLTEIIRQINSLLFIHDKDNNLILSNCPHFLSGECRQCVMKDTINGKLLIDNAYELKQVIDNQRITDSHQIQDCSLPISFVERERKKVDSVEGKPYAITLLYDISEQKQREKSLLEAQQKAQAATLSRERFLATMSHELRTPIAGVYGLLDLLEQKSHQQELSDIISQSQQSMAHLNRLVDGILDYSKIDSGEMSIVAVDCELVTILCDSIRSFEVKARQKGLDYLVTIEPTSTLWLRVDSTRVVQIISNLLSNAIKFTHQGFIKTAIMISDNQLSITVSDSGIGMSDEQLIQVMKPFTQADDSITRQYGGTGLGLSIVDKLVENMQGQLKIKSTPNSGTVVNVMLPFEEIKQPKLDLPDHITLDVLPYAVKQWTEQWGITTEIVKEPAEPSLYLSDDEIKYPDLLLKALLNIHSTTDKPAEQALKLLEGKVLIAEDNPLNRSIIAMQLNSLQIEHKIVVDGTQAKDYLEKYQDVKLLITDYHMPQMDGHQLARFVHQQANYANLPIIGLTAEDSKTALQKAKDSGIDAVLLKPYTLKQLHHTLSQYLKPKISTLPLWLTPFSPQERLTIANVFVQSMQSDLDKLHACDDSLELKKVLHSIKGALGSIQLTELVTLAENAELTQGDEFFEEQLTLLKQALEKELTTLSYWINNHE